MPPTASKREVRWNGFGGDLIYALRGDDSKDFWRYSISGDSWESLLDSPDKVKHGGALVYLSGDLYAFRGDDRKEFWKYSVNE